MSTAYECPLGLSSETLSAWRDRLLAPSEAQRISAHVRECHACRERLAGFERLGLPLRAERVPEPDEQLWVAVRAAMARTPQRGRFAGARRGRRPNRPAWRAVAAVAAVLLLAVAFATLYGALLPGRQSTGKPTPTVSPRVSPTATSTPGRLAWQTATWPPGKNGPDNVHVGPSLSPADGNAAYLCQPGNTQQDDEQVWATHNFAASNHGARWARLSDLPVAEQAISACVIFLDMTDPSTLLVAISPVASSPQATPAPRNFASFDGGQTWRELGQTPLYFHSGVVSALASYQGKIYAIFSTIFPTYPQFGNYTLYVSGDQMRTWHPISPAVVDDFWLDSQGAILAHERDSREFIISNDGGTTWQSLVGSVPFDTVSYVVRAPVAGQSWAVCGLALPSGTSSSGPPNSTYVCTQASAGPLRTLPSLPGAPASVPDPAGQIRLIGITTDGSVLAMLGLTAIPKAPTSSPGYTLWRLPPGGTQWQSLGIPAQYDVVYAPGALFAWPDGQVIMRPCPTCPADQSPYVAAYP